jgi:acyl-CoA synthetase (AMP-forming)/AMP-acid ligase II
MACQVRTDIAPLLEIFLNKSTHTKQMSNPTNSHRLLWAGFLRSAGRFPTRRAIDIGGREVTYQQLADRAKRLAATLQATSNGGVPLTAVFAYRSETAYAAVLGALMGGMVTYP